MKAEIYYLEEQEGLIAGVAEDLRAQLYPALAVEPHLIAFSDRREIVDLGRRYVKLLQASIRPETGLQLGIKELDHYGYRFYIYVYHAFAYSASGPIQLQAFFPAIAVRNRMALVPAGLGKMLQWGSSETLGAVLKSFEMGGAAEVSFADRPALKEALAQVAQTTRADLRQEIRAYTSHRNPADVDPLTLARDMDVDIDFLRQLGAGGVEQALYDQLTCEISPEEIAFDRWTKMTLSVRNDSDVSFSQLEAKISGEVRIQPARIRLDVPARSTGSVQFALKPIDRGELLLGVVLLPPDEQVFSSWLPEKPLWLTCN
jgi:hypothetical protein